MEGYKWGLFLNCALGWEQTESCQAKTSQATPTSQPQDLSQSKSQNCIYFFKPRQCVFNVCMCTSMRACLLSSDKSNRVIYTGGKVCSSALWDSVCLFLCQYHQYHRWQRVRRDVELCGQTEVSLFHTRDTSLRSRWMRKTRAPERPCHPGKYNFTLASLKCWQQKVKRSLIKTRRSFLFMVP